MIRVVCWNIDKRAQPWRVLAEMAQREEADIALLQEAGNPPDELGHLVQHDDERWNQDLYDRWPLVVRLSDRVEVNWLRQVAPRSELDEGEIGVSGIGTLAAARVWPRDRPEDAFLAVVGADQSPASGENEQSVWSKVLGEHLVGRVGVEPPRRQQAERIVPRSVVVFVKNGSPRASPVREVVRPRPDAASLRRRVIRLRHEHHVPTFGRTKVARVAPLPGGALNDDNHASRSVCPIRSANVSRKAGS